MPDSGVIRSQAGYCGTGSYPHKQRSGTDASRKGASAGFRAHATPANMCGVLIEWQSYTLVLSILAGHEPEIMKGEADSVLSDDKGGFSLCGPSEVEHPAGSRRLRQDVSSVPNIPLSPSL